MSVFVVHLTGADAHKTADRLRQEYSGGAHHELDDRLFLVSSDGIANSVAEALGLSGDDPDGPTGVIFKLNASYAGFDRRAVWDWLAQAERSKTA